jgi:hypothetical protein
VSDLPPGNLTAPEFWAAGLLLTMRQVMLHPRIRGQECSEVLIGALDDVPKQHRAKVRDLLSRSEPHLPASPPILRNTLRVMVDHFDVINA